MVNKIRYNSRENGDIVLMEIRDSSQRILYRNKFRTTDEDGIYNFLKTFDILLYQQKLILAEEIF